MSAQSGKTTSEKEEKKRCCACGNDTACADSVQSISSTGREVYVCRLCFFDFVRDAAVDRAPSGARPE